MGPFGQDVRTELVRMRWVGGSEGGGFFWRGEGGWVFESHPGCRVAPHPAWAGVWVWVELGGSGIVGDVHREGGLSLSKKAGEAKFELSSAPAPVKKKAKGAKGPVALSKLIEQYYATLGEFAHQNVMYEMGTRPAFHALLAAQGVEPAYTRLYVGPLRSWSGKALTDAVGLRRDHLTAKIGWNFAKG